METSSIQALQKDDVVDDKEDNTLCLAGHLMKQSLNFVIVSPELTYDQDTHLSLCFRKWIDFVHELNIQIFKLIGCVVNNIRISEYFSRNNACKCTKI